MRRHAAAEALLHPSLFIVTLRYLVPLEKIDGTDASIRAIVTGVLLAVAIVMPHRQVWVFPLPVTVSMRIFVIVMGAIEFFSTIGSTGDGVSHVCHLGGMLVGYIYLRRGSYLYNYRNFFTDWKRRRLRKKFEVYVRDHNEKPPSNPDNWVN